MPESAKSAEAELSGRLRTRLEEIDEATLARVYAITPPEARDPEYAEGLRTTVRAALEYGIAALEGNPDWLPPVPVALLAQARLAARNGISLETVVRRYFVGYSLLGDFLLEEAQAIGLGQGEELKRLMRVSAALFDRVLVAVSDEYGREARERASSSRQRRAERVDRLLAGDLASPTGLPYEFEAHHLGLVAAGAGAADGLRHLAGQLDANPLIVPRGDGTAWAWLGARSGHNPRKVAALAAPELPDGVVLAIGESGEKLVGWRRTHLQAKAALPVAVRSSRTVVAYGDVALVATVLQDHFLADSLRQMFIAPLESEGDGAAIALETLRAYFAAERNAASAAAALGITRQAVNSRLRIVEERLGRSVNGCAAELEVALRARDLEEQTQPIPVPTQG